MLIAVPLRRKGLAPLATTISTERTAPVIAGMRLRAGKTGSGKGAGCMVAHAIVTARAAGAKPVHSAYLPLHQVDQKLPIFMRQDGPDY